LASDEWTLGKRGGSEGEGEGDEEIEGDRVETRERAGERDSESFFANIHIVSL